MHGCCGLLDALLADVEVAFEAVESVVAAVHEHPRPPPPPLALQGLRPSSPGAGGVVSGAAPGRVLALEVVRGAGEEGEGVAAEGAPRPRVAVQGGEAGGVLGGALAPVRRPVAGGRAAAGAPAHVAGAGVAPLVAAAQAPLARQAQAQKGDGEGGAQKETGADKHGQLV